MRLARTLERMLAIDGLTTPENRTVVRWGFALAGVAVLLRIVFWVVAQRYWEDALITCLHAENFALGHGLTHVRPGEPPLHGFTSPLSVTVPLLGDLMRVGFGVDFLKLVSLPASALTVLYVLAIAIHPAVRLAALLAVVAMGYVAIEHHQILWGMAGMETQLATLILLMSIYYVIAWKPIPLGITLGLCMLARPDYAFWTIIAGCYGLVRAPRDLPKIVAIAVAVYAPWILFCLWHYGSPLPNTVVAKGLGYPQWWEKAETIDFFTIKRHTWMMMAEQIHLLLGPTFAGHGAGLHIFFSDGPESPIANLMFAFAAIGTLAIVVARKWALWPLAACVVVYSLYYVYLVPVVFGWYKVPYIATLLLLSLWGIQTAARLIPSHTFRSGLLASFAVVYLGVFVSVLPLTFWTERQIQEHVENAVRKPAGEWLRANMKENEAVGCEPLGYISYYSRGNVYDWPGLASRTVVAWSKEHPNERNLEGMLKGLQPDYLFLRDMEILFWFQDPEWFRERYHVAAVFQVDPEAAKHIRWLDRNIDTRFRIYKKNREGDPPYDDSLWPTRESFAGRVMGKPTTFTP